MEAKKVLVVDDEADLVELVSYNLLKEGFSVASAPDGETALAKLRKDSYQLLVLDLMLPGLQGMELCRIIRSDPAIGAIPIIMLTAKGDEVDRVLGLEMGADDYMAKPFSPRELVARVKAVLRRSETPQPAAQTTVPLAGVLKVQDIVIDRERYAVAVDGRPVKLSATEFKLLLYLAERPGRIFSRDFLLDAVWGNDVFIEPRTVDVHIRRLRAKIEGDPNTPRYLKTMRGIGYYLEA